MKRSGKRRMLIPILVVLLALVIVIFLATQKDTLQTTYLLKANVTELRINDSKIIVGVSNDPTEFNFGVTSLNMTVEKSLNITNNWDVDAKIIITKTGNIDKYVRIGQEEFMLGKGEGREVSVLFNGTSKGVFLGVLQIDAVTPKYAALAPLSLWS